jgi:hypothetical protein
MMERDQEIFFTMRELPRMLNRFLPEDSDGFKISDTE